MKFSLILTMSMRIVSEVEPDRLFVPGRMVFEAELAKIRSPPARLTSLSCPVPALGRIAHPVNPTLLKKNATL
jgi:hypothetical protein